MQLFPEIDMVLFGLQCHLGVRLCSAEHPQSDRLYRRSLHSRNQIFLLSLLGVSAPLNLMIKQMFCFNCSLG